MISLVTSMMAGTFAKIVSTTGAEKSRTTRRRLSKVLIIATLALNASVSWAQTQTPSQSLPPSGSTTTRPGTSSTQQPAPPGGREAGAAGAGQTAATTLQRSQLSSSQFLDPTGMSIERLVSTGFERRADLLGARQRLAVAEGRLIQSGLRPNPTLETEYGSARFLGGSAESQFDVGVSQVFETAGKRRKRVEVARAELEQARAEVLALERRFAAEVRSSYARAVAAGRQLDALERLIVANEELVRITGARLREGDVAPIDLNVVRVETDRLRAQVIRTRADLEGEIISLRALVGFETTEPLRIAPLPDRPLRLDISITDLTEIALRERADLRAARLGEQLGRARIRLAQSQATPNIAGSVRYSRERRITDLPQSLGVGSVGQTDNVLRFGVAVELPVFNKNQGEILSATGEREQAVRQREFLEATIKRDVALAYRRYRAAAEAFVLYATQIVPRSEENVRSVRAAYNLGEFSIFDVVNEQRRLIESETGYNEALRDYYNALAELETALGTPIPNTGFAASSVSVLPDLDSINSGNPPRLVLASSPSPSSITPAQVTMPLQTIAPTSKKLAASQPISGTQP